MSTAKSYKDLSLIPGLVQPTDDRWQKPGYVARLRLKSMLLVGVLSALQALIKVEKVGFTDFTDGKDLGKPVLLVSWHGTMLVPFYCHRNLNLVIMNSLSEDGDLMSKVVYYYGYHSVRGSSSRGGMRGLLEMVKLGRKGMPLSLVVDGPRGPIYEVKPGIVMMAQKIGGYILPIGMAFSQCLTLNSWDKTKLPLPFSRAVMHTGKPFLIAPDISLEEGCEIVKQHLHESNRQAEIYLKTGKLSEA